VKPNHPGARLLYRAELILILVTQLRGTGFVADLPRLQDQVTGMLLDFQKRARADAIAAPRIALAMEVLSALIDHVVTSMPWGADAGWQSVGIPSNGRRPLQRLLEVTRKSSSDAGISELVSVALLLGFDARGPDADNLEIDRLLTPLGDPKNPAPAHKGPALQPPPVERGKPSIGWRALWISSLAAVALLAVLFFVLQRSLAVSSSRLSALMADLRPPSVEAPRPQPPPGQGR
jgi:type VI protein secretion system component VasF